MNKKWIKWVIITFAVVFMVTLQSNIVSANTSTGNEGSVRLEYLRGDHSLNWWLYPKHTILEYNFVGEITVRFTNGRTKVYYIGGLHHGTMSGYVSAPSSKNVIKATITGYAVFIDGEKDTVIPTTISYTQH